MKNKIGCNAEARAHQGYDPRVIGLYAAIGYQHVRCSIGRQGILKKTVHFPDLIPPEEDRNQVITLNP